MNLSGPFTVSEFLPRATKPGLASDLTQIPGNAAPSKTPPQFLKFRKLYKSEQYLFLRLSTLHKLALQIGNSGWMAEP